MKTLALSVAVLLMTGLAVADDRLTVVPNRIREGFGPFANRTFADVPTSVSEAPTGRFMAGSEEREDLKSRSPQLEKRLEDMERKMDRILKELRDLRDTLKPAN